MVKVQARQKRERSGAVTQSPHFFEEETKVIKYCSGFHISIQARPPQPHPPIPFPIPLQLKILLPGSELCLATLTCEMNTIGEKTILKGDNNIRDHSHV